MAFVILIGLAPIAYFVLSGTGFAEASQNSTPIDSMIDPLDRDLENLSFGVGEHLEFEVKYGFISAGTATMGVERLIEYENRPCYLISSVAQSNSF
ncbi:MAG TPA: DUF3108 domain-containing protein, partial [candidate division Zixibacteria bacterium]|nr:DUF3108 domain-containing protein [candidate division Zixibacteria bacterium]